MEYIFLGVIATYLGTLLQILMWFILFSPLFIYKKIMEPKRRKILDEIRELEKKGLIDEAQPKWKELKKLY